MTNPIAINSLSVCMTTPLPRSGGPFPYSFGTKTKTKRPEISKYHDHGRPRIMRSPFPYRTHTSPSRTETRCLQVVQAVPRSGPGRMV